MKKNNIYPFCAIVGQDDMKKALILNIINPSLGGVLIRGEKGTAKSTAVRSLIDIMPEIEVVEGCIYSCERNNEDNWCEECKSKENINFVNKKMKVVNLPVSATEDRVVGTLDIEYAIKHGEKKFEPGILALANRNILYIDEVNLLDDHVVDVLLDAAAMGVNNIEREGISYTHPSRFILVGTMNPEEGDLRPQLIDRFGLVVDVFSEDDVLSRVEVMKRRIEFEKDNEKFIDCYKEDGLALVEKINKAKQLIDKVTFTDEILEVISRISIELDVDGHRADIALIKTAITNAAFMGRDKVIKEDLFEACKLALPHRMRRTPFEEGIMDLDYVLEIINSYDFE